ncbi:MAG: 50S ribosomal protein L11 methyltransferase [Sphingomonas sp.]
MAGADKSKQMARAAFGPIVVAAAGDARKLTALASIAQRIGLSSRIYPIAREAQLLAPHDPDIQRQTRALIAASVPAWHFYMVRDETRNNDYKAAIERAVGPDTTVLDIGSGTGLLAMMAARAGAKSVVSCEMNPAIAEAATEIVALNGYADRIRVIGRKSTDLDPEVDLGGRVDLIVSEIIAGNLLSEGVLPVIADATARLLAPGGRMIPASGQVVVSLVDLADFGDQRMGDVSGFDMRPFNRLEGPVRKIYIGNRGITLRGEPADLFGFDFSTRGPWRNRHHSIELVADGGRVNGVIQWIRLQIDQDTVHENRPAPGAMSSWVASIRPFERSIMPAAGTRIQVNGAHDDHSVRIWVDERQFERM